MRVQLPVVGGLIPEEPVQDFLARQRGALDLGLHGDLRHGHHGSDSAS